MKGNVGIMTTNHVESRNKAILDARKLSVIFLIIDLFRRLLNILIKVGWKLHYNLLKVKVSLSMLTSCWVKWPNVLLDIVWNCLTERHDFFKYLLGMLDLREVITIPFRSKSPRIHMENGKIIRSCFLIWLLVVSMWKWIMNCLWAIGISWRIYRRFMVVYLNQYQTKSNCVGQCIFIFQRCLMTKMLKRRREWESSRDFKM